MSLVSPVFHPVVTVNWSQSSERQNKTILTPAYTFIELVVYDWFRPVFQTEDPDPYPLTNGGQN